MISVILARMGWSGIIPGLSYSLIGKGKYRGVWRYFMVIRFTSSKVSIHANADGISLIEKLKETLLPHKAEKLDGELTFEIPRLESIDIRPEEVAALLRNGQENKEKLGNAINWFKTNLHSLSEQIRKEAASWQDAEDVSEEKSAAARRKRLIAEMLDDKERELLKSELGEVNSLAALDTLRELYK